MSYTHPKFPSGYATIRVTQEDIENGARRVWFACPISLAISRELGCCAGVATKTATMLPELVDVPLPEEATKFILDFDSGDPVQPFEFQIPWRP